MLRIAVLDDYQRLARKVADWSAVDAIGQVTVFDRALGVPDEAAEVLRDFEVICLMRERMACPRALIERLPNLRLIAVTGARNRSLDLEAAQERGITVSYTDRRGTSGFATVELAWGLIVALARHIPLEATAMRVSGWQNSVGVALAGRTLGLLGLGHLGSRMVPIARAFDMHTIAWSPNLTAEKAADAGAERVDKDELFARSDVVSIHLVLGERSRGLVGARELSRMQPTAYLVNTSRGPIVDEDALIAALRERRIAGAALDVFDREPLPDEHPLRDLPNTILTPHLGYWVEEFVKLAYEDTVENILAFARGEPMRVLRP